MTRNSMLVLNDFAGISALSSAELNNGLSLIMTHLSHNYVTRCTHLSHLRMPKCKKQLSTVTFLANGH